jgi:hypothetical protein
VEWECHVKMWEHGTGGESEPMGDGNTQQAGPDEYDTGKAKENAAPLK